MFNLFKLNQLIMYIMVLIAVIVSLLIPYYYCMLVNIVYNNCIFETKFTLFLLFCCIFAGDFICWFNKELS